MVDVFDFADIYNYLKKNKIIKNLKAMSELTGNNYSYLSELKTGRKPMSADFVRNINQILKTNFRLKSVSYKEPVAEIFEAREGREIPLYNKEVFGTISSAFDDNEILMPVAIRKIPLFSKADGAVQVKGSSMKGYINNGDWIVIRRIINKDLIIYGEPYLIITKTDNYRTVKFLKESMDDPDALTLVPYNIEQFDPQDIPRDEVLELYAIIGLFRSM